MMGRHRPGLVSLLPALIALAMLSFASVQSVLMRTAMPDVDVAGMAVAPAALPMPGMATPMSPDMDMPDMDMPGMAPSTPVGRSHGGHRVHHAACPYCAAAAHLPIIERATPPRRSAAVSFAAFRLLSAAGPRGPPFLTLRARGPPA